MTLLVQKDMLIVFRNHYEVLLRFARISCFLKNWRIIIFNQTRAIRYRYVGRKCKIEM